MHYYIGLDIGGSHVSAALIKKDNEKLVTESTADFTIDSNAPASDIIQQLSTAIISNCSGIEADNIQGIGVSMPGPFDYNKGVSKISGLGKYDALFGINLKASIISVLNGFQAAQQMVTFLNDAEAFLLGVAETQNLHQKNITATTIGTGFGSAGLWNGELIAGFPGKGYLYNDNFYDATAEDYFSTRWFLKQAGNVDAGQFQVMGVKELAELSPQSKNIQEIFKTFGKNLADYFNRLFEQKSPDLLLLGGNIIKARHLFSNEFDKNFSHDVPVKWVDYTSNYAAIGAVVHHLRRLNNGNSSAEIRSSASPLLPAHKQCIPDGYDIYPVNTLVQGKINEGFEQFTEYLKGLHSNRIIIDGNSGVLWERFILSIQTACKQTGLHPVFYDVQAAMKPEKEIEAMLTPYLGEDSPVFGKLFEGNIADFFNAEELQKIKPEPGKLSIIYGTGAALSGWDAPILYVDIPKNEIQYRSRAGCITNLGKQEPDEPKMMYKRYYFADWPVCNKHKEELLPNLTAIVDGQREHTITWAGGDGIRKTLAEIAKKPFRVRPWFEPGVWGGKWMQKHMKGLNPEAENFAWSFELIAPENGVILERKGKMLEVGFEWLMYQSSHDILGEDSEIYGTYFPLRFDYLDTMEGGNLSLQCHPSLDYIKKHFGEQITQDETYYMMKSEPGAIVYLGFQQGVDPGEFEAKLTEAQEKGSIFDADKFVQSFPAEKHDLFLIPAGTIHCSGKGNLVLEISNTPYIYTFKMYDWQRLDLDGKPRPINIERAMDNLDFSIQGKRVHEEFISRPRELESGPPGRVIDLSTHENHLYRVHRIEVEEAMAIQTNNKFHLLNLVEGEVAEICTDNSKKTIHYAETLIVPAAVEEYKIVNKSEGTVKLVKAFMK